MLMRLPHVTSLVLLIVFVLTAIWLILVATAPFLVPPNTLTDLSGSVGVRDNTEQFSHLSSLPRAVYSIGDVECHQIASRSFFLNGNEMPFCSRDFGLFLGLALGFGFVSFYRFKIHPLLALAGLVPIGIDGGLQAVTSYESNNALRLATGLIAGIALSLLLALYVYLIEEASSSLRRKKENPSAEKNSGSGV